jgi:hypothetical protein
MPFIDPFDQQTIDTKSNGKGSFVDPFSGNAQPTSQTERTPEKKKDLLSMISEAMKVISSGSPVGALTTPWSEDSKLPNLVSGNSEFGQVQRGFMAGVLNPTVQAANVIPGVNIPEIKFGEKQELPYKIGETAGDIADYTALAALVPGGLAGQALAGGAYGAITNPNNRITSGAIGAALPIVGGSVIKAGKAGMDAWKGLSKEIEDATKNLSTTRFAIDKAKNELNAPDPTDEIRKNKFLEKISGGLHGEEDALTRNRKEISNSIESKYNKHREAYVNEHDKWINGDNFGSNDIYEDHAEAFRNYENSLRNLKIADARKIQPSPNDISVIQDYIRKYGDSKPVKKTVSEADKEIKRLNEEIRGYVWDMKRGTGQRGTTGSTSTYEAFEDAQKRLAKIKGDFNSYLEKYPDKKASYDLMNDFYGEFVSSFKKNPRIAEIAKEINEDPRNAGKMFAYPSEAEKKVLEFLGDEGKDRLLYDVIGRYNPSKDSESLLKARDLLDQSGLRPLLTDKSSKGFSDLEISHNKALGEQLKKQKELDFLNKKHETLSEQLKQLHGIRKGDVSKLRWLTAGIPGVGATYELFKHF